MIVMALGWSCKVKTASELEEKQKQIMNSW